MVGGIGIHGLVEYPIPQPGVECLFTAPPPPTHHLQQSIYQLKGTTEVERESEQEK